VKRKGVAVGVRVGVGVNVAVGKLVARVVGVGSGVLSRFAGISGEKAGSPNGTGLGVRVPGATTKPAIARAMTTEATKVTNFELIVA
jgi:hypothetical protein